MNPFLQGASLSTEVRRVLSEPAPRAAVAFWGAGAQDWISAPDARIVCNLATGGTNPHVIRKLLGRCQVRQCDRLHAKVYLGSDRAIVTSANASANGVGLEGVEQAGWIEAGLLTRDVESIGVWFEELWQTARPITQTDLRSAEELWSARRSSRPSVGRFESFDVEAARLPLIAWHQPLSGWGYDEDVLGDDGLAGFPDLRARADAGHELGEGERTETVADRWILFFVRTGKRKVDRRSVPWFEKAGDTRLRKAFFYEGETRKRDLLLAPERPSKPPFDPAEPRFLDAFRTVLQRPKFAALLAEDDGVEPWYGDREDLTRRFWGEMKQAYSE